MNGTDKVTIHSYGEVYDRVLAPHKETATSVLEIGVFSGASAVVWSEYFSNAQIHGIDITMAMVKFGLQNPRIHYRVVDGTRDNAPELLDNNTYDVIIEDASHLPDHQIATYRVFAPYMKKGGVYIVEDIHEQHAARVKNELQNLAEKNNMRFEWIDLRHVKGRFDDIMAVIYNDKDMVSSEPTVVYSGESAESALEQPL